MNRYQYSNIVQSKSKKRFYTNNIYPYIPPSDMDIYLVTSQEDRYDLLANLYYRDVTLWWVLPTANNLECFSLYPPVGIQLRVPMNIETVLQSYKMANL